MDRAWCHNANIALFHREGITIKTVGTIATGNVDYFHVVMIMEHRIAIASVASYGDINRVIDTVYCGTIIILAFVEEIMGGWS